MGTRAFDKITYNISGVVIAQSLYRAFWSKVYHIYAYDVPAMKVTSDGMMASYMTSRNVAI